MKEWMALNGSDIPRRAIGKMEKSGEQKSWTRRDYERTYEAMRRGVSFDALISHFGVPRHIVKAADYSYQAFAYVAHGWSTDERLMRFHVIKYRALTKRGELPF